MKKLLLLTQLTLAFLRREAASAAVVFVSLAVSLGISFSMLAYCADYMGTLSDIADDKATYSFNFRLPPPEADAASPAPMELFDRIFFSGSFPGVKQCYDTLSFYTYSQNEEPDVLWQPYFENGFHSGNASCAVSQGRFISDNEYSAPVAVVSREYFPSASPGDKITVLGAEVTVIGLSQSGFFLPYGFMKSLSGQEKGFAPVSFSCTFTRPFSQQELDSLQYPAVLNAVCRFDISGARYARDIFLAVLVSGGILFIIILNMFSLFCCIINKSAPACKVARLCGADKTFVFCGLFLPPALITLLAYLAGLALYASLIDPLLVAHLKYQPLSAPYYACTFVFTMLFMFITLLPAVRRISGAGRPSARRHKA